LVRILTRLNLRRWPGRHTAKARWCCRCTAVERHHVRGYVAGAWRRVRRSPHARAGRTRARARCSAARRGTRGTRPRRARTGKTRGSRAGAAPARLRPRPHTTHPPRSRRRTARPLGYRRFCDVKTLGNQCGQLRYPATVGNFLKNRHAFYLFVFKLVWPTLPKVSNVLR
jgi:hypothetical protein